MSRCPARMESSVDFPAPAPCPTNVTAAGAGPGAGAGAGVRARAQTVCARDNHAGAARDVRGEAAEHRAARGRKAPRKALGHDRDRVPGRGASASLRHGSAGGRERRLFGCGAPRLQPALDQGVEPPWIAARQQRARLRRALRATLEPRHPPARPHPHSRVTRAAVGRREVASTRRRLGGRGTGRGGSTGRRGGRGGWPSRRGRRKCGCSTPRSSRSPASPAQPGTHPRAAWRYMLGESTSC
jgi:hypothetical protein